MKKLNSDNSAVQTVNLYAGANLDIDNDLEYLLCSSVRPVVVRIRMRLGETKGYLQTNTQTLTITPNIYDYNTYDAVGDLVCPSYSWTNDSKETGEVNIGPLVIPANRYLRLIGKSSDAADTAVKIGSANIEIIDCSPGDIDYVKGAAAGATGTAGKLDVNVTEVGGATPITAADITDDWESQSQADPTGFHVNVAEYTTQGGADLTTYIALQLNGLNDPTATENAAAVLNKLLADHTTAGSLSAVMRLIADILEGDEEQDFANSQVIIKHKTTKAALKTKDATDKDDNPITSSTVAIANLTEPV